MFLRYLCALTLLAFSATSFAASPADLNNQAAPQFEAKSQDGKAFKLSDRKGQGWTVLFFYPRAGSPGCTTQTCAFRDSIKVIRKLNTTVYGISTNTVAEQKKFHDEHKLTFDLLSDADMTIVKKFNVPVKEENKAARTTFILDPNLTVRKVLENVDPALDAKQVATMIEEMQKEKPSL